MPAEHAAILFLVIYALAAIGLVAWCIRRSGVEPVAWALYVVERIHVALFFHWRANRRSTIPANGPAIIIANHRSPVDPMLIWMNNHLGDRRGPIRIISFLMAREYYELRCLTWLFRAMRSIPVDRDGQDMRPAREALRRLKSGDVIGVFPEGRINTGQTGAELLPADPGVAWLALRSRLPVLPIYIHNSPCGSNMVAPFFTPARVFVCYGEPIDLSAYYDRRMTRELLDEVVALMMQRLAETGRLAKLPAAPESEAEEPPHIVPMHRAIG